MQEHEYAVYETQGTMMRCIAKFKDIASATMYIQAMLEQYYDETDLILSVKRIPVTDTDSLHIYDITGEEIQF